MAVIHDRIAPTNVLRISLRQQGEEGAEEAGNTGGDEQDDDGQDDNEWDDDEVHQPEEAPDDEDFAEVGFTMGQATAKEGFEARRQGLDYQLIYLPDFPPGELSAPAHISEDQDHSTPSQRQHK